MAKRKLTAAQRKARKRAAYIKAEYMKTYHALEFISRYVPTEYKQPKAITKTTLKSIRKVYTQARRKAQLEGYVLPTKEQMAKEIKAEKWAKQIEYQQKTEIPDITIEQIDQQYIDDLKQRLEDMRDAQNVIAEKKALIEAKTPKEEIEKTSNNFDRNVRTKFDEAILRIIASIDDAIATIGVIKTAEILASDNFMQRVANLDEKYTYQIIESQNNEDENDIISLIESSVSKALEDA